MFFIQFQLLNMQSVLFELECSLGFVNFNEEKDPDEEKSSPPSKTSRNILLKGQMKYIQDINSIFYLCSPMWVIIDIWKTRKIHCSIYNAIVSSYLLIYTYNFIQQDFFKVSVWIQTISLLIINWYEMSCNDISIGIIGLKSCTSIVPNLTENF